MERKAHDVQMKRKQTDHVWATLTTVLLKDKEGNINCWAQKEKKKEGPDSTWKVYSRNRWCKKEIGSNGTAGLKSEQKRQPNNNERQQLNSGPNSHEASPTMLKGSGVKEIVGWEDKHNENDVTVASKLASSPRTCELLKEATINWDMAKNLGVNCSNQEGTMVCKLVSMDERDKGEAHRMGNNESD